MCTLQVAPLVRSVRLHLPAFCNENAQGSAALQSQLGGAGGAGGGMSVAPVVPLRGASPDDILSAANNVWLDGETWPRSVRGKGSQIAVHVCACLGGGEGSSTLESGVTGETMDATGKACNGAGHPPRRPSNMSSSVRVTQEQKADEVDDTEVGGRNGRSNRQSCHLDPWNPTPLNTLNNDMNDTTGDDSTPQETGATVPSTVEEGRSAGSGDADNDYTLYSGERMFQRRQLKQGMKVNKRQRSQLQTSQAALDELAEHRQVLEQQRGVAKTLRENAHRQRQAMLSYKQEQQRWNVGMQVKFLKVAEERKRLSEEAIHLQQQLKEKNSEVVHLKDTVNAGSSERVSRTDRVDVCGYV